MSVLAIVCAHLLLYAIVCYFVPVLAIVCARAGNRVRAFAIVCTCALAIEIRGGGPVVNGN